MNKWIRQNYDINKLHILTINHYIIHHKKNMIDRLSLLSKVKVIYNDVCIFLKKYFYSISKENFITIIRLFDLINLDLCQLFLCTSIARSKFIFIKNFLKITMDFLSIKIIFYLLIIIYLEYSNILVQKNKKIFKAIMFIY